jgi:hypothetical protein
MGSFSIWHWLIVLAVVLILNEEGAEANKDGQPAPAAGQINTQAQAQPQATTTAGGAQQAPRA